MHRQPSPLVLLAVLALGACNAATSASPSVVYSPSPAPSPSSAAFAKSFEVNGHRLSMQCVGTGSPTLVYLHGLGGTGFPLDTTFSTRTRVCTYDRLNAGSSEHLPGRRTGAQAVADLHALLAVAGIGPPYVLDGGSFGGLIAIIYIGTYPSEVKGLVMEDAALPADAEIDDILPEPDRTQVKKELANNGEAFEYSITAEAKAALVLVPDMPVSYIQATSMDIPANWPRDQIVSMTLQHAQDFVDRFTDGRVIRVDSQHYPQSAAMVEAIHQEIDRILTLTGV